MELRTQAVIIAGIEVGWVYHWLKGWGYAKHEREFILYYGSDGRRVSGNIWQLIILLGNPTMLHLIEEN